MTKKITTFSLRITAASISAFSFCSCNPVDSGKIKTNVSTEMISIQMPAVSNKDINIEFVYDASGSMGDTVKNLDGKAEKKYVIANKALLSAATLIQNSTITQKRNINCGMWMLRNGSPQKVFDLAKFDMAKFQTFCKTFCDPDGGTPLGLTIDSATCDVLRNRTYKNYIVIISDGENNQGRSPEESIIEKTNFSNNDADLKFFLVAFDVNSKIYEKIKKLKNASVFDAADEKQLTERLGFIVGQKILMENE